MLLEREATRSFFLNALPMAERALLLARCRSVTLPVHSVLYESEETPLQAFFITSGFASVVTSMPDGSTVEVGVVGREGVSGSLHLLGPCIISTRCMMQLQGTALTLPLAQLATFFAQSEPIRRCLLEFVQSQSASLGQLAACHRLHLAEERLARWLLMVQDRVESDRLDLTQEFLANMLGSRRTTVTKAAGVLENTGAIAFRRGHLHILDREKLIAAACVCYPIVQQLFTSLYGRGAPPELLPVPRKLAI
jgi:CRP-like cAMP-binding protein